MPIARHALIIRTTAAALVPLTTINGNKTEIDAVTIVIKENTL
jgi:hypothetical protein